MSLNFNNFVMGTSVTPGVPITITIPAGSAVSIIAQISSGLFAGGYFQGSVIDTGGNIYVASGGANPTGTPESYLDSFYCLNTTKSATTVTYTPNVNITPIFAMFVGIWVWNVSSGACIFGSISTNGQITPGAGGPGTGVNATTSGSVNCATGSVIMGLVYQGGDTYAVGTGFTQDYNTFGAVAEHGAFNASQAATWTATTGTVQTPSIAMSFGFALATPIANTFVGANTLNVSSVISPGTNLFSFSNPAEHINVSTIVTNVTVYNIVATGANTNISVPTVADTIVYNAGNSTYTHTISGNAIPTITISVPADILH